jgi:ABC-type antimicrobial peptide transport system permease subunit
VLVRAGGRRSLLAGAGVLLAATMLGTAVTVSWSLATGFDRSAKAADLPDVIARFDRERVGEIDEKLRALPNVAATSYRTEITRVRLSGGTGSTRRGVVQVVGPGRRGYAIVEGRDARGDDDVVVERGVARAWHLSVGDTLSFGRFGTARVSGIAVSPDNVAFPLATTARVYVAAQNGLRRGTNMALVWTHDPGRVDITLQQARATSFGVQDLRFITHDGVRVLLDQAAGIVLALLIAFSAVVLGAAGVMLGVAAHADVQRRLSTIGVQRALGFPRATIVGAYALRAAIVALPAAIAGLALGALLAAGPTGDLLATLNELPPGAALLGPLAIALAATVALVAAASA